MSLPSICVECGYQGHPKTITRGSLLTELMLWLLLIVPGVIYSIWRLTTRYRGCPECGAHMIPGDTPMGKMLLQQASSAPEAEPEAEGWLMSRRLGHHESQKQKVRNWY
jgi:hypothetical protein